MGIISGRTVLRFRIKRDGNLSHLQLLGYEGHKSLMETSMRAVQVSAPFRPLPKDFPEEYLEITYTFEYLLSR
jgi:outer membrane biosynthesis protein TonB